MESRDLLALSFISGLTACSYVDDDTCFERAETAFYADQLPNPTAKLTCIDTRTWADQEDCTLTERVGDRVRITLDLGPLEGDASTDAWDYRMVGNYSCGNAHGGEVTSGTEFSEFTSGSGVNVVTTTLEARQCSDDDIVEMDLYLANYEDSTGECKRPVGAWSLTSYPDGHAKVTEYSLYGGETYQDF